MNTELEAVAEFLTGNQMAAGNLPWCNLGSEDLMVVRRWAGETLPLPAERRLLRELRQFIRSVEVSDQEPAAASVRPALLRAHRRQETLAPFAARPARMLLESCRDASDATARRDCAVISLILLAGLRRHELMELRRGDYDDDDGRIEVKTRRGGRRTILLEGECHGDLEHWLAERGSSGGPLFLAYTPSGSPVPRGIAGSTVNRILTRRGAEAGVDGLTPSALRSRFVWQLQAGARQGGGLRGRYYLGDDGQPGWALSSLSGV